LGEWREGSSPQAPMLFQGETRGRGNKNRGSKNVMFSVHTHTHTHIYTLLEELTDYTDLL
jgi:hypothetical protein